MAQYISTVGSWKGDHSAASFGNVNWLGGSFNGAGDPGPDGAGRRYLESTSSDGKSKNFPDSGDSGTDKENPPELKNQFWCEKTDKWTLTGNPSAATESEAMEIKLKGKISSSWYGTVVCGYTHGFFRPGGYQYSPIFDPAVTGLSFKWSRFENSTKTDSTYPRAQRLKLIKVGGIFAKSSYPQLDCYTWNHTIFNYAFEHGYSSGSESLSFIDDTNERGGNASHLIGVYFQVKTEGNGGSMGTEGSYIKIWDLHPLIYGSYPIILPRYAYWNHNDPPPTDDSPYGYEVVWHEK